MIACIIIGVMVSYLVTGQKTEIVCFVTNQYSRDFLQGRFWGNVGS